MPSHKVSLKCLGMRFIKPLVWLVLTLGSFGMSVRMVAQPGRTSLLAPEIQTLRVMVDDDPGRLPVIRLGSGERLQISFDDMTHEYRRFTYRIEHCDFDGKVTESLFESDYVSSAFEEEVIENYEPSINTTVQYTHYSFSLPNRRMRPLLSGNYRLTVRTENEDGESVPVIQTYFAVVDPQVNIRPACSTNTDEDWNTVHQQLSLRVDCGRLALRDAGNEIRLMVMQNRRVDNAVVNPPFTAQDNQVLIWEHDRSLIFDAGNEYRKMELLSTRYPGMHGDHIKWFDPFYHYTLMPDYPRKNYLYDEDRDGLSIVRCEGTGNPDIEADYTVTHFTLSMLPLLDHEVYVTGQWASMGLTSTHRMTYNHDTQAYEAALLLKQGYYNYMYLAVDKNNPSSSRTLPIEGDYYQTENEYSILVYYQPTGSRYCQLVGCVTPIFRKP